MANKLSDKKIKEMWKAYQEKQTVRYVAQKCQVSRTTARRYKIKDNWDERTKEIKKKVEEKIDETIVSFKIRTFKINKIIIKRFLEQLGITRDKNGNLIDGPTDKEISVSDYEKIVKLCFYLLGEPESNPPADIPEEEKRRRLRALINELNRRKLV